MNLLIMGPQGSGKSTQAKLLAEKLSLPYLSTGEIFRRMAKEKTPLGRKIKALINSGQLVDNKTTVETVEKFLKKPESKKGFVAEGFPRNLWQAKYFQDLFDKVFYLKVGQKEIIKRLTARRVCKNCGANFNLITQPPKRKGVCDYCGGELTTREDDKERAIKRRLGIYFQETQPVLDFFRKKGILEEVDGERPIETIFKEILKKLKIE